MKRRQLDNFRHIGNAISNISSDEDILMFVDQYVLLHYPKNKHRRQWAKDNILLFCESAIEKRQPSIGATVKITKRNMSVNADWVDSMDQFIGKETTVSRIDNGRVYLAIDDGVWAWDYEWLERIPLV
jgi:hypothetical protein